LQNESLSIKLIKITCSLASGFKQAKQFAHVASLGFGDLKSIDAELRRLSIFTQEGKGKVPTGQIDNPDLLSGLVKISFFTEEVINPYLIKVAKDAVGGLWGKSLVVAVKLREGRL
jgi:hypothetical protein